MNNKGFTLIEMTMVVAIVGALTAFVTTKIGDTPIKTKEAATKANLAIMNAALAQHEHDYEMQRPFDINTFLTDKYFPNGVPPVCIPPYHECTNKVWMNAPADPDAPGWLITQAQSGTYQIHPNCTHEDSKGNVWRSIGN